MMTLNMPGTEMNMKFDELQKLGAGEFEHKNGSLFDHLGTTYKLLKKWGATEALCDAGLYHAAYGTEGFEPNVVDLSRRNEIASIIGQSAEKTVYLYCACDREYVFLNLNACEPVKYRDRFTSTEFSLTNEQAMNFCELTVANELELAIANETFKNKHRKRLFDLFTKMAPLLSKEANKSVNEVLGPIV
jgi:hypothetical protein